jgi:hypothetical protein
MEDEYKRYRVSLKSVPGMYAQYDGNLEVFATNEEDAINEAHRKLKRGAFPDRDRSMWRVESVECLEE